MKTIKTAIITITGIKLRLEAIITHIIVMASLIIIIVVRISILIGILRIVLIVIQTITHRRRYIVIKRTQTNKRNNCIVKS